MVQGARPFYRLTSEGRALWSRRQDLELPDNYRRILGVVDFCGYRDVIRSHLARYPERVVDDWLAEFETLNLIEATLLHPPDIAEFFRKVPPPPLEQDDKDRIDADARFADISLSRLGVYVSHERVTNRPAAWKTPKHTLALVVEDDPDQRALAVLRLTSAGYPVQTVDSMKALVGYLQARRPDVIFLDVVLPDGDGFDVLAALRRHPAYALLPIIMVTAKSEPENIAKGLALGADAYVTKPYGKNTLDYVLRYVLQQELPEAPSVAVAEPPSATAAPAQAPAEMHAARPKPASAAPAPAAEHPLPSPAETPIAVPAGEQADEKLKTRDDVHALLAEVAIHREAQQSQNAARWRVVKRVALMVCLFLAVLQFYMMDTLNRIASLQSVPVFAPVSTRDLRSVLLNVDDARG